MVVSGWFYFFSYVFVIVRVFFLFEKNWRVIGFIFTEDYLLFGILEFLRSLDLNF